MDNLLSQHKGKVTTDDLCVLLTAEINNAAKHGQLSLLIIVHGNWGNVCVGGGGGAVIFESSCDSAHLSSWPVFLVLFGWYFVKCYVA